MIRKAVSFWQEELEASGGGRHPSSTLDADQSVDCLVIGGGFSGLTAAIELKRRAPGARVALAEAQRIGFGASGRNAGMLVPLAAPSWLIEGALERGRAKWALGALAQRYQALGASLATLDGGPSPSSMFLCAPSSLACEAVAWIYRRLTDQGQISELIGARETYDRTGEAARLSLVMPAYAIHPARLALALREQAARLGVLVYEHSRVARLDRGARALLAVMEGGAVCRAEKIVCSCGAWNQELLTGLRGTVAETWMLATAPLAHDILCRLGHAGSLVVSVKPEFMYRRVYGSRLLLGGLDDIVRNPSPAGRVPEDVLPRLLRLLEESVPWLKGVDVELLWGGPIHAMQVDEMPHFRLHKADPRISVAAGLSGSGVVWGLLAGSLLAGLVDPALDTEEDRLLREALTAAKLPVLGAAKLGVQMLIRALFRPSGRPGVPSAPGAYVPRSPP